MPNFDVPSQANTHEKKEGPSTDPLLASTIHDEAAKERRASDFDRAWQERFAVDPGGKSGKSGYFQTKETESPFARFSSKGWKIHIAFPKGREKEVARLLYENGLYFKIESVQGTYFFGNKESGSTIYIGSHDNMEAIASLLEEKFGEMLADGGYVQAGDKIIRSGSGADIEVRPKIMARFDVAKSPFGWLKGNKKYGEHGLPTWTGLGGIPILAKEEKQLNDFLEKGNASTESQRQIIYTHFFKRIYQEAKEELVQDFGQDFLEGKPGGA